MLFLLTGGEGDPLVAVLYAIVVGLVLACCCCLCCLCRWWWRSSHGAQKHRPPRRTTRPAGFSDEDPLWMGGEGDDYSHLDRRGEWGPRRHPPERHPMCGMGRGMGEARYSVAANEDWDDEFDACSLTGYSSQPGSRCGGGRPTSVRY